MALSAILRWYLVLGLLAAIGSVTISRSRFSPRAEHIFFALLLVLLAAVYLAFVAYFGDYRTLRPEAWAVAVFAAPGLLCLRFPALLVLGARVRASSRPSSGSIDLCGRWADRLQLICKSIGGLTVECQEEPT